MIKIKPDKSTVTTFLRCYTG